MKARINFRNENKESKVFPFVNSAKLIDLLCETRFGKVVAYVLFYVFRVESVVFE